MILDIFSSTPIRDFRVLEFKFYFLIKVNNIRYHVTSSKQIIKVLYFLAYTRQSKFMSFHTLAKSEQILPAWYKNTNKRKDVWSRDFMIWKVNFGLWAVAWAGLWNKRVWANYEQKLRPVFSVFQSQKNFFWFFWKHHNVRTEKLHKKKANPKKNCTKEWMLFLASMGGMGLCHDIFLNSHLGLSRSLRSNDNRPLNFEAANSKFGDNS